MNKTINDDPTIKEFLLNRDLQPSTIRSYLYTINVYSEFINLKPYEFIEEAEKEEKERIMMRKRAIKGHLLSFKQYLTAEKNYSPQNISKMITTIRSFYHEFQIELPHIIIRKKPSERQTISDIPTFEHIHEILKLCNRKYSAIIILMLSSGMGAGEVLSLNYSDFLNSIMTYLDIPIDKMVDIGVLRNKLLEIKLQDDLIVGTWNVRRKKTNMDYVTFSSPESIIYILEYLIQSPPKDLKSPLFRIAKNSDTGLTYGTLNMKFARMNDELGYGKIGTNRFFHSHTLRKLFATTLYKKKLQQLTVDWFLGHKIDPITEAYFKSDIDSLKEQYISCIKDLSVEEIEIKTLQSPEYHELKVQYEKDSKAKDGEMSELKEQVEYLTTIVKMITDPKTNKTPKFMEGREDIMEYVEKNKDKILKNSD
jgi:integrase